jgi:ferredoxin-NADP reductase
MAISKARVLGIKEYGSEIKEYTLKLEKNYYFEAGTFLLLTLELKDDYTRWPDSRNFSIASAYNENETIRLIIRKVGEYTHRIFNELEVGSDCVVKYAYGDFLLPFFDKAAPIYCIAGGTGIAPILSFTEQLRKNDDANRLHVFYSFKNSLEQPGIELLKEVVPSNQLHLFSTREKINGVNNRRILFTDISNADFKNGHFYICGCEEFTMNFVKYLKANNSENIYTDEW